MKTFTIPFKYSRQASRNKIEWFDVSLRVIIYSLTSIAIYGYYPSIVRLLHQHFPNTPIFAMKKVHLSPAITANSIQAPRIAPFDAISFKTKHPLTGVFISHNEKIALINNLFFHVGEKVDNMKIVKVTLDGVTLSNGKDNVMLSIMG